MPNIERSPATRYRCPECGEIHRDVDGECIYECGSVLEPIHTAMLYHVPHRFQEARYGGLCDDCGGRRDNSVHDHAH